MCELKGNSGMESVRRLLWWSGIGVCLAVMGLC